MNGHTLEEWVQAQENLVETFRRQGRNYEANFPVVPDEYTNWIDELRATVETAALADLSHHMTALRLEGPDVIDFLKRFCANDFDNYEIGQAKQIVICNHDGDIMGDGPLMRLDDEVFYGPGIHATKWLKYNLEIGDWDVDAWIEPPTPALDGDPESFVYQLQGPKSNDVLRELTDDDFESIGFYRFDTIDLAGREVRALGHGMSPESGLELHGPYEYADELRSAIVEAGEPHGLRELGSRVYVSGSVRLGWVPPFIKPVYHLEEMKGYREWVTAEKAAKYGKFSGGGGTLESTFSIEGSFESTDVTDYYMSPIELGYEKLIDFDHDFVGRDALLAEREDPKRSLVSLLWDHDDTCRVHDSIFGDGENYKFFNNLPRIGWASMPYDEVRKDGELVGISHSRSFEWDIRGIVSLARLDLQYTEPGTEVTLIWGQPGGRSSNPRIEDHHQTEIEATVAEARYVEDRR